MPLIFALLLAQTTPVQPIQKGTGLPPAPPGTEEAAIMTPVNGLFAALAARDGQAMLRYARPEAAVTVADEKADGTRAVRRTTFTEFAAGLKPGPERYEERLSDAAIEYDGDIAMVWGRYDFLIDGKVHHCGYDHVDLVRDGGRWQIANITYSSRTTGCGG